MTTVGKVAGVLCVVLVSIYGAVGAIKTHLLEAEQQEKTLADLILKQQVQEQLAAAAVLVEEELEAQNLVIDQAEVELKPSTIVEPEPEPEIEEVEAPVEDEPVVEELPEMVEETQTPAVPTVTYMALPAVESIDDVEGFLIAHYFLNGYDYVTAETDATLRAEKEVAYALECCVVDTIEDMMGLVDAISNLDLIQTQTIYAEMVAQQTAVRETYGYLEIDPTFGAVYQATDDYFVQGVALAEMAVNLLTDVQNSTNALLAFSTLTTRVNTDLMPQLDVTLEAVLTMKEHTNAIYLQNASVTLITKDDARTLIGALETMLVSW